MNQWKQDDDFFKDFEKVTGQVTKAWWKMAGIALIVNLIFWLALIVGAVLIVKAVF